MTDRQVKLLKTQEQEDRFVLGVVYAPDEVDYHGATMKESEVEKMAWTLMKNISVGRSLVDEACQVIKAIQDDKEVEVDITCLVKAMESQNSPVGFAHSVYSDELGSIVESYIVRSDQQIGEDFVKKGTWMLGMQLSEPVYELVKSGDIVGFSFGGTGVITPIEDGDK